MKLTRESLDKSLELAAEVTKDKGPWKTCFHMFGDTGEWGMLSGITYHGSVVDERNYNMIALADSNYIAHHSPTFITALVQAHIEALNLISALADNEHVYKTIGRNYIGQIPECVEFLSKHGGEQ